MRKGTILRNPWVNDTSPLCKGMYMGIKGNMFEVWSVNDGKIVKSNYHKKDLGAFVELGYTNVWKNFIKDLESDLEML